MLMYLCTCQWGTGYAGVQKVQPIPQPKQNPSIYPGVSATCANPYTLVPNSPLNC